MRAFRPHETEIIQNLMDKQETQAKAAKLLVDVHAIKENDYEALAILLMLTATVQELLPKGVQK